MPSLKALSRDGSLIEQARVTEILGFRGLERVPVDMVEAGDIVALAGFSRPRSADSLLDLSVERADSGPADRPLDHRHDLLGQ